MPCATPTETCRTSGRACPVRCDLSRFEKCQDERQRVQLQVLEILMHEEDGRPVESSEQDKVDAILAVAPLFARAWSRGHRCPDRIARIVEGVMMGEALDRMAGPGDNGAA